MPARIARAFNRAELVWAAGGSLMLALRGADVPVHDIDLMVGEADGGRAGELLRSMGTRQADKTGGRYRTRVFEVYVVDGVDGEVREIPLTPQSIDAQAEADGVPVPLHAVAAWRTLYRLIGREDKLELIDRLFGP